MRKRAVTIGSVAALVASALVGIATVAANPASATPSPSVPSSEQARARAEAALSAHAPDFRVSGADALGLARAVVDTSGAVARAVQPDVPRPAGPRRRLRRPHQAGRQLRRRLGRPGRAADAVHHPREDPRPRPRRPRRPTSRARSPESAAPSSSSTPRSGVGRLAYETVVTGWAPDGQTPSVLHVLTDARHRRVHRLLRRDQDRQRHRQQHLLRHRHASTPPCPGAPTTMIDPSTATATPAT